MTGFADISDLVRQHKPTDDLRFANLQKALKPAYALPLVDGTAQSSGDCENKGEVGEGATSKIFQVISLQPGRGMYVQRAARMGEDAPLLYGANVFLLFAIV